MLFLACEVENEKPQIQQRECNCHDDIDNDNDWFVDEQDSDCQYVVINKLLSIVNSEIMELIGDGTCDNFCSCNTIDITHYFSQDCPPSIPLIPYCTTNINQNELDSLLDHRTTLQNMTPIIPSCFSPYPLPPFFPCPSTPFSPLELVYKDSTCQFGWVKSSPEQCVDCIDNDNDGLLDYDDLECPEDLIESCMMDTTSLCSYFQQQCEDDNNEFTSYCQSYLDECSSNCEDDSTCIEQCQNDYQFCAGEVENNYQECIIYSDEIYSDCITTDFEMFYQECITQIEEFCFNTHCTCDSTANN